MNSSVRDRAIILRKAGLSYGEISTELAVSRGTLSFWFKGFELGEEQIKRLKSIQEEALKKGREVSRESRKSSFLKHKAEEEAVSSKLFEEYKKESFFMSGLMIAWCQGIKNPINYRAASSDADMIKILHSWLKTYAKESETKIHFKIEMSESMKKRDSQAFWSQFFNVSREKVVCVYNKPAIKAFTATYYGYITLSISGRMYQRRIEAWQRAGIRYYMKEVG